jgi:recombination associated protein RdgC
MMFKNLHLYRLHDMSVIEGLSMPAQHDDAMARDLTGIQSRHIGWINPFGTDDCRRVLVMGHHRLLSALHQEKILPSCVVNDDVNERVDTIEAAEGRTLRRRERLTIKEQVFEELLPRAFIRRKRVDIWIDIEHGIIAVNCTTPTMAERVLDLLRHTLGSLKVTPLSVAVPPTQVMTTWLKSGEIPEGVALGESATLSAPGGEDGTMSVKDFDLQGEEVSTALDHGRLVTVLEMGIEGVASFKLHDDMSIKRLSFADAIIDEAESADDEEDAKLRLESDFAIMAQAMAPAIQQLISYMGGEAQPATTTTEGK